MIQKAVGISFRPTSDERIVKGSTVKLVHDKDNQYSSRAIAIMFEDIFLGFIGEKGNEDHEKIFEVLPLEGKVVTISRLLPGEEFSSFKPGEITHLEVEFPMASDSDGKIESFNEGIRLTFLKEDHRYVYEGKDLVSATTYIKRWIAPFDKENIARVCASKYGCHSSSVVDYWDGNGDVAATFGTAIHNALEHYEKFAWLGAIIQQQKGLTSNPALPSHPALRKIVEDFYKLNLQQGEVVCEALITNVEKGICGFADRILITGDKKCRVQDYKINIDSEAESSNIKYLGQMASLPKNKLSKYQLQMSVYARMLELSGWTVEGLDVFVYEDEWKHFCLSQLNLDF